MTDLKPCPFCGSEAFLNNIEPHRHSIADFMPDHPGSATVECKKCNAGLIDETEEKVIAAWNTRPEYKWATLGEWLEKSEVKVWPTLAETWESAREKK